MKKNLKLLSMILASMLVAFAFTSCEEEDNEPSELQLQELVAEGTIDLNAATTASGVPVNPVIVATFNTNVDPATANDQNITLVQDYNDEPIDITVSVSEDEVSITPTETLSTGALYELSFSSALMSNAGKPFTELSRNFTTAGTFAPSGMVAHWTFEGNADDVVGDYDPESDGVVAITYTDSRNDSAGTAATFDGDASIIEIPNADELIDTDDFTISFWVKTNSEGHVNADGNPTGHFVLGLGAFFGIQFEIFGGYDGAKFAIQYELEDGTTAAEDMWFPAEATDNTTGGWQGWDFAKSLTAEEMQGLLKDTWLHVVYTFDAADKRGTLYYNGEKMKTLDFDLWPEDDAKRGVVGLAYGGSTPDVYPELALGFVHSREGTMWDNEPWGGYEFPTANHFKGKLDDLRIFHKPLTDTEVSLMYNSESQ